MNTGVILNKGFYNCQRCHNKKQRLFGSYPNILKDDELIIYCRYCTSVEQANTKEQLTIKEKMIPLESSFILKMPFPLTLMQKQAVLKLKANLIAQNTILLQAVCGAGKTEIIAAVIAKALKQKKYIGWAIARKDVVIEISERLATYFPNTEIIALYQNSKDLGKEGQLTILTTARLYDYFHYFDLLIIDENDAYPFNIDEHQKFAAQQSIADDGVTLHISATILKKQKKDYQYITSIARRFHDYDLPSIYFAKYALKYALISKKIFPKMKNFLLSCFQKGYPIFIFVSNKKLGNTFKEILTKELASLNIEFVSSDLSNRTDILNDIRTGKLNILVTTTILERGVTFESLQVIVLDADARIFDAPTLIQIAGRVGRSINHPTGKIYFLYQYNITSAMHKARRYHNNANKGIVDFL